jgi:transposase
MRYELSNDEWTAIKLMLPNKPRGVPGVNDRRVLNGIFSHRSGCGCALMSPRLSHSADASNFTAAFGT